MYDNGGAKKVTNLMFKTNCAYCGKQMFAYAKNKQGELPKVYCSKVCEGQVNYEKKFYRK